MTDAAMQERREQFDRYRLDRRTRDFVDLRKTGHDHRSIDDAEPVAPLRVQLRANLLVGSSALLQAVRGLVAKARAA